tara:strand:- start:1 stop:438 length:438 start_codon:yes stop_codon:yes gene_type:complete
MPKKKKLDEFSPMMQQLLKLRDSQKSEWTESDSLPYDQDSKESSTSFPNLDNALMDLSILKYDPGKNELEETLKDLNKLQRKSSELFYLIKTNNATKELKIEYLQLNKEIKKINTYLLKGLLGKTYMLYEIKKGSKKSILIKGDY